MNTTIQGPTMAVHSDPVSTPTNNESGRCQFRYSNGKRCRLQGSEPHFGLCSHHFCLSKPGTSQQSFNDSEDLSAELLPQLSESRSGVDISKFLSRLLILITKGPLVALPSSLTLQTSFSIPATLAPAITVSSNKAAARCSTSATRSSPRMPPPLKVPPGMSEPLKPQ